MDLKISWPAYINIKCTVSHICNLTLSVATSMTLDPNSTPTVVSESILNLFSRNCISMQDFPTPINIKHQFTCIADDDVLE